MTSYRRMGERGRQTSQTYHLRAAVKVTRFEPYDVPQPDGSTRTVDPGTYEVIGECGHRLDLIRPGRVPLWEQAIADQQRHRRRCRYCPKGQRP